MVRGTTFVVQQTGARGEVELIEGRVEFRWADTSQVDVLGPGNKLAWPRAEEREREDQERVAPRDDALAEEPRSKTSKQNRSTRESPQPPSADEGLAAEIDTNLRPVLRRLIQLRSQQRYREAVDLLRAQMNKPGLIEPQRERLSYEVGALLTDEIGDSSEACRHWRNHAKSFKKGQRREAVAERLRACHEVKP